MAPSYALIGAARRIPYCAFGLGPHRKPPIRSGDSGYPSDRWRVFMGGGTEVVSVGFVCKCADCGQWVEASGNIREAERVYAVHA